MTNSNILAALIELLEEKGIVGRQEVLGRIKKLGEEVKGGQEKA